MNDLSRTLVWSAAQVTLLAGAAALAYLVVARRRPAAGASVAAVGLAGCVALTLLAGMPLPSWWTWKQALSTPSVATGAAESPKHESAEMQIGSETATQSTVSPTFGLDWLRAAWDRIESATAVSAERPLHWPTVVVALFVGGAVLGLTRLLLGAYAVARCRRASRRIDDRALNDLAAALSAALGCRQRVDLRASPDLAGPATAGWRRPMLLLPQGWETWDAQERRAVLAHELAHVRRGDFAARVLAGVGVALHFYHPLMHWLAGRLRLQQELAADALAARYAGGRAAYVRALARLALRLDDRPLAWPAQSFLSSPRNLIRRLQMLKAKDGMRESGFARIGLTALLAAGVVAVSAMRSPAQKGDEKPTPPGDPPAERVYAGGFRSTRGFAVKPGAAREPFDLTYVQPDARGVLVVRPAALFALPGADKIAAILDRELRDNAKAMGFAKWIDLKTANVEQYTSILHLLHFPMKT